MWLFLWGCIFRLLFVELVPSSKGIKKVSSTVRIFVEVEPDPVHHHNRLYDFGEWVVLLRNRDREGIDALGSDGMGNIFLYKVPETKVENRTERSEGIIKQNLIYFLKLIFYAILVFFSTKY